RVRPRHSRQWGERPTVDRVARGELDGQPDREAVREMERRVLIGVLDVRLRRIRLPEIMTDEGSPVAEAPGVARRLDLHRDRDGSNARGATERPPVVSL